MELRHFSKDGIQYYQLHIQSPIGLEHNITTFPTCWKHGKLVDGSECGGDIFIGDNGCYYCEKCGAMEPVANWAYRRPYICNGEIDREEYLKVLRGNAIAQALALSSKITSCENGFNFLNRLLFALENQEFGSQGGETLYLTLDPKEEIIGDNKEM